MNLSDIEKQPDVMDIQQLVTLFQQAILEFECKQLQQKEFLDILIELADRQARTYELLEMHTRNPLDQLLCELWNTDCYEDVDSILYIVVNLGLRKCFQRIKQSIQENKHIDEAILQEINETIVEVGEHISNPYFDLEKYK